MAWLQQSLSTLRACISTDYARLVFGDWLNLTAQIGYCRVAKKYFNVHIPTLWAWHGATETRHNPPLKK